MFDDGALFGDLYAYESLLDDDERAELARIRHFLQTEVKPRAAEHWEAATFPVDLIPRFAAEGLVGRSYDTEGERRARETTRHTRPRRRRACRRRDPARTTAWRRRRRASRGATARRPTRASPTPMSPTPTATATASCAATT